MKGTVVKGQRRFEPIIIELVLDSAHDANVLRKLLDNKDKGEDCVCNNDLEEELAILLDALDVLE